MPPLPPPRPLPKLPPSNLPKPSDAPTGAGAKPATVPGIAAKPGSAPAASRLVARDARDLDEQRKMGLASLAVDTVTGEEISPHIPRTITAVPWYNSHAGAQTLVHQRKMDASIDVAALRSPVPGVAGARPQTVCKTVDGSTAVGGIAVVAQAKTFRVGACTNCGSSSHKDRDCTERRRAVGAKFNPTNIAPDVAVDDGAWDRKTYEQKRDRTAGIDLAAAADAAAAIPVVPGDGAPLDQAPLVAAAPLKSLRAENGPLATASTTGSLRSENKELPKYLYNLNDGSAIYDPATRAMRGNPQQLKPGQDAKYVVSSVKFEGDNAKSRGGGYQDALQSMVHGLVTAKEGEAGTAFGASSPFLPTANEFSLKAAKDAEIQEQRRKAELLEQAYGPQLPSKRAER